MSLSIKQLSEDPWSTIETKFPAGKQTQWSGKEHHSLWCVC